MLTYRAYRSRRHRCTAVEEISLLRCLNASVSRRRAPLHSRTCLIHRAPSRTHIMDRCGAEWAAVTYKAHFQHANSPRHRYNYPSHYPLRSPRPPAHRWTLLRAKHCWSWRRSWARGWEKCSRASTRHDARGTTLVSIDPCGDHLACTPYPTARRRLGSTVTQESRPAHPGLPALAQETRSKRSHRELFEIVRG